MEQIEDITNYLCPAPDIYTGGQPTPGEIAALGQAGFQIVINLAMDNSPDALPDEQELVQEAGMAYVHIPVVWEAPAQADLLKFFTFFHPYRAFKTFTHCALNMRVSAFVFLYRVIVEKEPVETCQPALLKIWQPNEIWQKFIDDMLRQVKPPEGNPDWQFDWQPGQPPRNLPY
jgi:protein tyrosine phosphatase (PTP) superfamily phosphohydrolase (DUF442 family)